MSQRVLVTGASGFLGGHLAQALVAAGHTVRALVRQPPHQAWLTGGGVEIKLGDLADPAAVSGSVEGVDVVYHCGATMSGDWQAYERGTVIGTRHVTDACLARHVKMVHVSSLSVYDVYGLAKGANVTEAWRLDPHPERRGNYARAKVEAERVVTDAVGRGLSAVIIRPGLIYGPRGPVVLSDIGKLVAGRVLVLTGSASFPLPLAYVENVVDGLIQAGVKDIRSGDIFHIVDRELLSRGQYARRLRAVIPGCLVVTVPSWVLETAAIGCEWAFALMGKRSAAPVTRYRLAALTRHRLFDGRHAERELGWMPRVGIDEGLRRTLTPAADSSTRAASEAASDTRPSRVG